MSLTQGQLPRVGQDSRGVWFHSACSDTQSGRHLCLSFYPQEPQRLTPKRAPQPSPGCHPSPTLGADSGTLCLSLSRPAPGELSLSCCRPSI